MRPDRITYVALGAGASPEWKKHMAPEPPPARVRPPGEQAHPPGVDGEGRSAPLFGRVAPVVEFHATTQATWVRKWP